MKKLMLIIAVSMVSVLHAKTFKTAVEYNNFLVGEQKAIVEKINNVYAVMGEDVFNLSKVKKARKQLEKQCASSIKKVAGTDAYQSNEDFKKACLTLFDCYNEYASNGLAEMVSIFANKNRTQVDVDRYDEIVSNFDLIAGIDFLLFEYAQEDFALANDFVLASK